MIPTECAPHTGGKLDTPILTTVSREHAHAITRIYEHAMIGPPIFQDMLASLTTRSAQHHELQPLGGFINPPDPNDMKTALNHGLIVACLVGGQVVAYNRVLTTAEKVQEAFCREFLINRPIWRMDEAHLEDWTGHYPLSSNKTLKQIHWVDRERASIAIKAAKAGVLNHSSGKLAWSIDAAVDPTHRKLKLSRALLEHMNNTLKPAFQYRVFKVFEIRKIEEYEVSIPNILSRKAFVDPNSARFAFTEEDMTLGNGIRITIRWHHWLRQFGHPVPTDPSHNGTNC